MHLIIKHAVIFKFIKELVLCLDKKQIIGTCWKTFKGLIFKFISFSKVLSLCFLVKIAMCNWKAMIRKYFYSIIF